MNPSQIETKLKVAKDRLVHKLKVTQEQLSQEPRPDALALNINLRQLQNCQERVNKLREDLEKAVLTANDKEVTKKFDAEITEYETLNLDCDDAIATINAISENEEKSKEKLHSSEKNVKVTSPFAGMKLPELPKTTFNGDITMYQEFKQNFNVTIDSSELPDNRKLAYLKTMCIGDAENDLKGFPTTNENYAIAWGVLEEKYGNLKRTIDVLYKKITNLPKAASTTASLRKLYDEMEVAFRTLESLNESFDDNTILFTTVKEKYPKEIVYEIYQHAEGTLTLAKFRTKLKGIIQKREELNFDTEVAETEPSTYTTESLMVKTNNETKKPTQKCIFCSSDKHWSDECDKHKTMAARKDNIKGRCFICLRKGHSVKECTADRVCVHCGQRKNHHRSLCPKLFEEESQQNATKQQSADPKTNATGSNDTTSTVSCLLSDREQNWLLTAVATIINPDNGKHLEARIVLDGGKNLIIDTVGDRKQQELLSNIVQFQIKTMTGKVISIEANTIVKIIDDVEPFNPEQLPDKSILRDKKLADTSKRTDIQILIGIDHLYDILTSEILKIGEHQYLISSKLGWLFAGKLATSNQKKKVSCLLLKTIHAETNNDLKCLWELDTLGIKTEIDMNDDIALKSFDETIQYENNRYNVSWPLIEEEPELKTNYGLALGRLDNLLKKSNQKDLAEYDKIIKQYLEAEFIEPVEDKDPVGNLISYLPHHGVKTESKTTPLRIVFDGSAKQKGEKSVNDIIYKGKNLIEQLVLILSRWRTYGIAVISDIEKAFLQLIINAKFRDLLRFIWVKNYQLKTTKDNTLVLRWCRIPFGITASPFTLAATILFHLKKYPGPVASKLSKALYVDNMLSGSETIKEVSDLIKNALEIFADASMKLRQWHTNEKTLVSLHPSLDWLNDEIVSVLGLHWNTNTDTLSVKLIETDNTIATKRSILKYSSKVYDPLGFWSPVILKAKLILQQLWEEDFDWDQPIPNNLKIEWFELLEEFRKMSQVKLPRRCLSPHRINSKVQLHVFTDASKKAYGIVIYVRVETTTGADTQLIFAKSRVAPIKSALKIPRLELLAMLIGNRMLCFIQDAFNEYEVTKFMLWSDSKCAIAWAQSNKNLSPWVEKRVTEIRKNDRLCINYVKSEDNPADIASRGSVVGDLTELWWQGPAWLREKESNWPMIKINESESEDFQTEVRCATLLTTDNVEPLKTPFEINIEEVGDMNELLMKTVTQLKLSVNRTNFETAKQTWIKYVQRVHFANEFECIIRKTEPKTNLVKKLNLFRDDDDILKVRGRLSNLIQAPNDNYPILLPKGHRFVYLLIVDTHKNLYHAGVSQTLAELCKEYWLLGGRRAVYNVIQNCKNCKVFSGPAYKYPIMPPIPGYRLKREFAFSYVGVDVLGPLYVCKKRNAEKKKNWICLFSCLITRAVHLEQLEDMTSEELLSAFRRMFARRGITQFFLSDNAPQFNVLRNLISSVQDHYLKNIEWKQIPAFSPWSGGVYERMVALVKSALRKTFYQVTLTRRQLQTTAVEIEAVINSRPIVYVGADDGMILSPSDLLNIPFNIPSIYEPSDSSNILRDIADNWKKGQQQLDAFWSVWRNGYIETLRAGRERLHAGHRSAPEPPKVGDVVIINQEKLPRGQWATGVIVDLNTSEDNQVRSAQVKLNTGNIITRPICLLHPIESEMKKISDIEQTPFEESTRPTANTTDPVTTVKPILEPMTVRRSVQREAATRAREKILEWINAK
ncbi:uncharacterized protein LOC135834164 [Planococcus citri]|uniref:uncharacterized protein LOC135834164 n=1 Tax=Planococcus citri TaxID=170843 RepID=UPI0031F75726